MALMTDKQYKATQDRMIELAIEMEKLDFLGYIERNSLADTTGPILNPTLYRDAAPNMQALRQLAMAGQGVKTAVWNVREKVVKLFAEGKMIMPEKLS